MIVSKREVSSCDGESDQSVRVTMMTAGSAVVMLTLGRRAFTGLFVVINS